MIRLALVALAIVFGGGEALAANCSSNPFTLTNGQTADATQVMANFNNLLNCANNNLAHNGANSDITSLSGLTTPLAQTEGGTGVAALTQNNLVTGNGGGGLNFIAPLTDGNILKVSGGVFISSLNTSGTLNSITDATNGGLNIVNGTTAGVIKLQPSDLLTKTTPVTADSLFLMDSAASNVAKTATSSNFMAAMLPIVVVQNRQPSGVNGEVLSTSAYTNRTITTKELDTAGLATIASPNITLAAGTWDIEAHISCGATLSSGACTTRLFNTTTGVTQVDSGNANNIVSTPISFVGGSAVNGEQTIVSRFKLNFQQQLKFQSFCTSGNCVAGNAVGSGEDEVYLTAKFTRVN